MALAGLQFSVLTAEIDERPQAGESPTDLVRRLASEKAAAVIAADHQTTPESLYIGADTVVIRDNQILGKPRSHDEAHEMLSSLSGRAHRVATGFCVSGGGKKHVETVTTRVWFRQLTPTVIARYVATGEPMDKAGAYGIQAGGGALVARIDGSYSNVVGLPIVETLAALAALGGPEL